jgi:hypothetical protein
MLQFETLPASLAGLLRVFRSCFTAPSFRTFCALAAGLVAQPGPGTVCGMLVGAGLSRVWHHSRAHWFFSRARWSADRVGLAVLGLVVERLLPAGEPVLIAVDDTLFRRSGRRVHAAAWLHDGAAKGPKKQDKVSWGNCWVIAGVVMALPFIDRPVCLPVAAALWRKGGPTKQVIAGRLITAIAAACPGRAVHVVADAWYAGAAGAAGAAKGATRARAWPEQVSLTSRLRVNASLRAIAEPVPGARGRARRIGPKLGTPKDLAADAAWTQTRVRRYGRDDAVHLAETVCLWYGVYRSRAVRVVLVREPGSRAKAGYDLALITTDLATPAEAIVERYAARWSVEVAIEDAKQITGVGQARNRVRRAVERTVPFGLYTQSLVTVWYAQHGHRPDIAERRRHAAPWYQSKTQPSYLDMITELRRTLIAARFLAGKPRTPTPEETLAVQMAWAEAAA